MRSALHALAILAALTAPALAQRAPLTAREFLTLDRPGEPALSPDGRWMAYTVTTTDLDGNRRRSDLWLVAADGSGSPRRLSTDSLGGRSAAFAPDSRRLAYVNARGGAPQIRVVDVASGAHTQVTRLSTGADGPLWSPDGSMIAFVSEVWPTCDDDACNARRDEEAERRPSRAMRFDGLLYRHWNTWEDGRRSHLHVVASDGSAPARDLLAGKDYDTPVPPFGGREQYAWRPDGRELAFTTKLATADQAWTTNLDIYTVAVAGGEPVLVTPGMGGAEQNPAWSPDGASLAFLSQARAGFESDRWRLMVLPRGAGAAPREVPRGFDDHIQEFAWTADGQGFYAGTDQRQRHRLMHIVLGSGEVHEVLADHNPTQLTIAQPGGRAVLGFVSDAMDRPPQVFAWMPGGRQPPRALTTLNAERVRTLAMNPSRAFGWTGAGGDSVFGLLLTPPNFDASRRYPAVILIHGGPQGAWHDNFHGRWNAQMFAAPGYVVALLNPRGSTGFGQRFLDEVSGDWGGRVYEDIMRGVDAVARLPYVDSTRMAAAGGSYGGYMVNWINGRSGRFRALISHAGIFNLEAMAGATEELWFTEWEFGGPLWGDRTSYGRWSPHRLAGSMRTPTLVIHGALDYRVPDTEGMQMFSALQRQGVPSRFLYFPDEGHWIGRPQNQLVWWNEVQEWLARYLGRPAS